MPNTSIVMISHGARGAFPNAQTAFWCDVRGRCVGGYRGAFAGRDEDTAVCFAVREMIRYGFFTRSSAVLVAPRAIEARVMAALEAKS